MKRGKKYEAAAKNVDKTKVYSVDEALGLAIDNKVSTFDESIEVHVRLAINAKKGDQQVRGAVVLPHGTGKTKKIAVITESAVDEAKKAGADIVGGEDLIADIKSGKFFDTPVDVIIATPEMMRKLAPAARVLGPKGLMPSPKSETVTTKVTEAIEGLKKGKVNFKNDSTAIVHQAIGKVSFGKEKIQENYEALLDAIQKSKPDAVKGKLIASVSVCSTMGPGIKVEL